MRQILYPRLLLLAAYATVSVPSCCFAFPTFRRATPLCPAPLIIRGSSSVLSAKRTATFGMGCFWAPAEEILKSPGILSTVAGYTGKGDASDPPSYEIVCMSRDWVEAVRVTFDDEIITYPQVLDAFFDSQEARIGSRQYGSFIFPDSEQAAEAKKWLGEARKASLVRKRDGFSVDATTIENPTKFFRAENYHQNFWQKWRLRIVALLFLLPISWGAFNGVLPEAALPYVETVQDSATAVYVLGLVAALLERKLDAEVIEM